MTSACGLTKHISNTHRKSWSYQVLYTKPFIANNRASSSQSQKEGIFTKHTVCWKILVIEIDNKLFWLEAKLLIENLQGISVYMLDATERIPYHGIVIG